MIRFDYGIFDIIKFFTEKKQACDSFQMPFMIEFNGKFYKQWHKSEFIQAILRLATARHLLSKGGRRNTKALFLKRVARLNAVTGDCLKSEYKQQQSSVSLSLDTSFLKEADETRKPSF